MTQLRRQMLDELERRNYSANTVRTYIRTVEDLVRYFKRRPDRLGPEHIRQYQAHLFRDRQLAANSVAQRVAALRFFLYQDARARVEPGSSALSEETAPTAQHPLSPGGRSSDRRRPPSFLSRDRDDALRHRSTPLGVDAPAHPRHRFRTHGRARSRRQGPQRPRRAALPTVARQLTRARSPPAAQTRAGAVSRRQVAHQR